MRIVSQWALGCLLVVSISTARAQDGRWTNSPQEEFARSSLMQKYQCVTCHTLMEDGGTVGPVLNQVADRRDVEWLRRWIRDPQQVKMGTKMPKFNLDDREFEDLIGYLSRLKRPRNTEIILSSAHDSEEKKGEALFRDYDCLACHRIGNEGRFVGPDLTWVGMRKTREWEAVWLGDPAAWKPDTFMPNFKLPDAVIRALTAYLHSLQGQANDQSREWEFNVNLFLNNKADRRGELVWKRFACWSCHGEEGSGGVRNPNADPNEEVPGLRDAANKYSEPELRQKLAVRGRQPALRPDLPAPPFECPDYGSSLRDREFADLYAYLRSLAPKRSRYRFK